MRSTTTLLALSMTLVLAACTKSGEPGTTADDAATPPAGAAQAPAAQPGAATGATTATPTATIATATLAATRGNTVGGQLRFEAGDGGVHVSGQVNGLPAGGQHGFHVHETGDCSAPDAESAGGHFNPTTAPHGRVGQPAHHAGDADNLVANAEGVAEVDRRLEGATLGDGSASDIVGKAVIVHANPDDYTSQPSGNAGPRLACGVIQPAG